MPDDTITTLPTGSPVKKGRDRWVVKCAREGCPAIAQAMTKQGCEDRWIEMSTKPLAQQGEGGEGSPLAGSGRPRAMGVRRKVSGLNSYHFYRGRLLAPGNWLLRVH